LQWLQAQLCRRALGREAQDRTLNDLLKSKRVDVVFGSWWQYPDSSVFPSVGMCTWIHDFQFVHFPEFYSASSLQVTRRGILRSVDMADRVVVSSRDALKDLLSFGPGAAQKACVLPFVAEISDQVYACDPRVAARRYHLPEKFVFLPNQFWRHKNHSVVLEALRLLAERGVRPNVVCSGLPHDPRMDTHFANLLRDVAEWGLHEQLIVLGLVPIDDVKALMRQAICVLNPSLFEGWSSTVEEAKSLGKRLLISDLAVHREQGPPAAVFFDPRDPSDLAQKLGIAWKDCSPGPDLELESMAQGSLRIRMRQFGETFVRIMQEVALSR
jgi:glycosyltransferase involved in cell wall biosynthesis